MKDVSKTLRSAHVTTQLLQIVDGIKIPDDAILVTINIEALYLSIPHELGIETISNFLGERDQTQRPMN